MKQTEWCVTGRGRYELLECSRQVGITGLASIEPAVTVPQRRWCHIVTLTYRWCHPGAPRQRCGAAVSRTGATLPRPSGGAGGVGVALGGDAVNQVLEQVDAAPGDASERHHLRGTADRLLGTPTDRV